MQVYSESLNRQIRKLRKQGLTFREINLELGTSIPKSTLSYICKDIDPGDAYRQRVHTDMNERLKFLRELALKKNAELFKSKLDNLKSGSLYAKEAIKNEQTAKIALAMLYLGEGSKWKSRRGPMLGSADPRIIRIYLNLLEYCYGVNRANIRVRIQHRADQNSIELEKFWQKVTGVTREQIYP